MSSLDSRNFEEENSQPLRLAANVASGTDSSQGNNLSRNATKLSEAFPSSDPTLPGASSNRLPISKSQHRIDGGVVQSEGRDHCFSLEEVLIATNNFDDALVIGIGGFGKVYKGFIDDGATMVAIKRLNAESKQGAGEFWTEIKMLSKLRHTNLVALIGYCNQCQEMILIYEYIALGTLADHLYKLKTTKSNSNISPPSWEQRLDMCIGAARGLDHLHSGTSQSFIHRDVKSTNILIDENRVAKISDFGLSKGPTSHSITHISTEVKGTFGYLDPDYFRTQRLTAKSDVYAFGVVLLEVLCGRPPVDRKLDEEQIGLVYWAQQCIKKGKFAEVIDASLSGQIAPRCFKSFVVLANNCLNESPRSRPTMAEVLGRLELALLSQRRGRTEGIMTNAIQSMMDMWLGERKDNSSSSGSSSGQSNDLLRSSEDPEIHFKYIKAAAKAGQIEEVERVTRVSNFYDPEKTKNFLMKTKLRDARPLINVCDRFGFVPELTHYLYANNMLSYIKGYVEKVNPRNALLVVRQLLDDDCPEDFIKGLILSVRSLLIIEPLLEEFEKRKRLRLLTEFLEHLALLSQHRGRNEGIRAKAFHRIDRWLKTGTQLYRHFSLADICEATKDFNKSFLVRNSDKVYKGSILIDGKARVVAIKKCKKLIAVVDESHFKKLLHPNILSLIGFCTKRGKLIVVHDYMANGSFQDHLHRADPPLSWERRLKICIGAAQGLEYLYANEERELNYRHIEPSSILLDENWVAKVMLPDIRTKTDIGAGIPRLVTRGYDSVYEEDDLRSFGVMLLEVLTCNKQLDIYRNPKHRDVPLRDSFRIFFQSENIYQVMDPHLIGEIGPECLREFVKITLSCLFEQGIQRPSIHHIVRSLQLALEMQKNWQITSTGTPIQKILDRDIFANSGRQAPNQLIQKKWQAPNHAPGYGWTEGPLGPIFAL
ncbi:uncharacterized protein LOC131315714 isoform X1 [Rhododendron vialii]|uniref:uncharacterized protein LOC131315714 isoform X1 n=1 Tax=Rhododendron vialii TaxID=182163 RepID=UPI00265F81BE|nr:uncharacterized protein LOC131315714 isoform X1 [Rhododendron vialii]